MEALPNPYEDETTESYEPWTVPTQEEIDAEFYTTEEMRAEAVKLIAIGETCRLVAENYIECMEDNEKLIKLNDYLITQQEINLKLCDEYKDWVKSEIAYSDRLFKQVVTWTIFITIYSAFAIWYLKG